MVEGSTSRDVEVQRELVQRILQSSHLSKSARLTELFQYLCSRVLDEDVQEIHELELGNKVFSRPYRYDTTADNIVRVHASLLRKRLGEYFRTEGSDEEFQVEIPRGNYAPIFRKRELPEIDLRVIEISPISAVPDLPLQPFETLPVAPMRPEPGVSAISVWNRWGFRALAAVLALVSVFLFFKLQEAKTTGAEANPFGKGAMQQFWSGLFVEKKSVDVVLDDASLAFYQKATGHPVAIADYYDRSYLRPLNSGQGIASGDPNKLYELIIKRQSNFSDASMVWKLAQIASVMRSDARLQFSRDLSFRDAKSESLILLGTPESNPWIQLFEGNLSMHWKYDAETDTSYPVDTTTPASTNQYNPPQDKTRAGYATVSFLPNLSNTGNVLILSGTGGGTTDAAMVWLTQEASLELLRSRLPDSRTSTFPYFEVLLRIDKGALQPRSVTIVVCRTLKFPH